MPVRALVGCVPSIIPVLVVQPTLPLSKPGLFSSWLLLLQLPPDYGPDGLARLLDWLDALPAGRACAVEMRHPCFYDRSPAELRALYRDTAIRTYRLD